MHDARIQKLEKMKCFDQYRQMRQGAPAQWKNANQERKSKWTHLLDIFQCATQDHNDSCKCSSTVII